MTQALATLELTPLIEAVSDRHEVRDPATGRLLGWINVDPDQFDGSLRRALMLNGFLFVTSDRR